MFDPEHLDATVAALADAAENDPAMDTRAAAARKRLAEAEAKLGLRAALENGTADPALIGPWLTDADQERTAAEIELQALDATARPDTSPEAVRELLEALRADYGDMAAVLADADPADKAALLSTLGVRVDWLPTTDRAKVTMVTDSACVRKRVGGATQTLSTRDPWQAWLVAA